MKKGIILLYAILISLTLATNTASAAEVWHIDLEATSLIANPVSGTLYASTPSSEGVIGNSVIPIDPATGEIGEAIFVGSEPGTLAISEDGTTLYTGLDGEFAIRKVDLTTMTAGLQFSLGSDPYYGSYGVEDIEVQPGDADVIAVSRIRPGWSPRHGGVAIFDNGTQRINTTQDHTGSNRIEFSDIAGTLYGCNNETTEFGFRRLRVDLDGVTELFVWEDYIDYFGREIEFHNGRIYATNGIVSYPGAPNVVGFCANVGWSNGVIANSDENRIYFITSDGHGHYIKIFDLTTFALLEVINIQGVNGGVTASLNDLVQWGPGELAFRTNGGQVFFVFTGVYGDMQIDKCKIKAGKKSYTDSIKLSGWMDATEADFIAAMGGDILVSLETEYISDLTIAFPLDSANFNKGKYTSPKSEFVSFSFDTVTGELKVSFKLADFTGVSCPITFRVQLGDYVAETVVEEDVVNGPNKPCPLPLMMTVMDSLNILKQKVKKGSAFATDSVSVKGTFTIDGPFAMPTSAIITIGTDTFTLPQGAFDYDGNGKHTCKSFNIANGTVSAKFDTVKATYSIKIKNTTLSDSGPVDFGINIFGRSLQAPSQITLPPDP